MKKIAVLLALMLVSVAGYAQDTTSKSKAEIKAEINEFVAFVKAGSDVIKCFE